MLRGGLLALQAAATSDGRTFPLDVLGAESAGMIGYVIEQELGNLLKERLFATLLTQVKVDPRDPAFDPSDQAYRPDLTQRLERFD
ncbi:carbamate kinase [Aminobacter aminovorans]|uniref:Carbamate kinase 2 n=1 Tax=Aminobacter aminovorans TaxID=83263 RepID=A0A380WMP7_AMIAI|nr:carbamate kinase [Aminobacter aminovorans]SUU89592.1 Carbamate kinase 2 [Aminobacter aminovorans]